MIDTQTIRTKILDLAMRGQLTEQLPEDGTAEELYQQIQAEKQNLIKLGKLKKEKELPEIKDDEKPFEIPLNWKWVRLGSLGTTITGSTPTKALAENYGGNYPFFKPSDLDAGMHISQPGEFLTELGKNSTRQVKSRSILVCCIGSIGKAAIIDTDGSFNQQINALTPFLCDSDYILYSIYSRLFQNQLNQGSTATTISIINKSKFDVCILPLPPLVEQQRIVEKMQQILFVLDAIDNLQSQYFNNQAVLKEKLIDAAIRGKLTEQLPEDGTAEELYQQIQVEKARLIKEGKIKKEKPLPPISEDEIPFGIPRNWKWVRLGVICNSISAGGDKPADFVKNKDDSHQIPVVANGISDDGIIGYTALATASSDTVTVAGRGTIGFSCYRAYDYCPVVRLIVISQCCGICPQYICYVFRGLPTESVGSSIPQLTVPMIITKLVPLPPYVEQRRIAAKLDELLNKIEMEKIND